MPTSSIPSGGGGGLNPKYQKFTSSGTFTLPDGYGAAKPLLVNIQIIGGGGGGSAQSVNWASSGVVLATRFNNYFGSNGQGSFIVNASTNSTLQNINGRGGGSGGIAATQMYLTSNLTITVGAAGTVLAAAAGAGGVIINSASDSFYNQGNFNQSVPITGTASGSGGTTTAGSVSAAGGTGGTVTNASVNLTYTNGQFSNRNSNGNISVNAVNAITSIDGGNHGSGGTPSGSAGGATPLLGTLAGGSGSDTPIFGSFGIGGKRTDINTNTGVEGTGGGAGAVGAPGAVILTWWQ
jgi:hypothetical protein